VASSSDSNPAGAQWSRHYEEAARRRRARGWHRRDSSAAPDRDFERKRERRFKLYVAAGALFVVATLVAMFLPR
jgi:hypothetical protein